MEGSHKRNVLDPVHFNKLGNSKPRPFRALLPEYRWPSSQSPLNVSFPPSHISLSLFLRSYLLLLLQHLMVPRKLWCVYRPGASQSGRTASRPVNTPLYIYKKALGTQRRGVFGGKRGYTKEKKNLIKSRVEINYRTLLDHRPSREPISALKNRR